MTIEFAERTPEQVFETVGDPQRITDWFILAKDVKIHPPGPDGEANFNVEFVFFGDVYESVLMWDAPRRYVYSARGPDFPIRDYVAMLEVEDHGEGTGVMRWSVYFDDMSGDEFERLLPVILPPINERSAERLAPMIGGTCWSMESFFEE